MNKADNRCREIIRGIASYVSTHNTLEHLDNLANYRQTKREWAAGRVSLPSLLSSAEKAYSGKG